MTTIDLAESTRKALEESFFAKQNAEVLAKYRQKTQDNQSKEELKSLTGIQDEEVLSALVKTGISSTSVAAMSLAPLVFVAWSDGSLDDKERDAIEQSFSKAGVASDSDAAKLVQNWLVSEPESNLFSTWKEYIKSLRSVIDDKQYSSLKNDILGRARSVAEAAGGFLGLAKVSKSEEEMLAKITSAFE